MLNAYSINASPLNTATVLGAAKRLAVNALAGATSTGAIAVQRFLSAQANATAAGTVLSTFYKQKNLAVNATAGVFYVTTDMNLFKSALGYTIKYLSAAPYATAKATPATPLLITGNMVVNAKAGAIATAKLAVQRFLSAQGKAGATGYETGFFSNAYMGANVIVSPKVTVSFVNIRGLSGLSPTVALAGANAVPPVLMSIRPLGANARAGATSSVILPGNRSLSVSAKATASALTSPPAIAKLKVLNVNANATALGTVTLFFNIYARAPAQRIVYAPFQSRTVLAPPAPRVPLEDVH